jgi:hypothetical protein
MHIHVGDDDKNFHDDLRLLILLGFYFILFSSRFGWACLWDNAWGVVFKIEVFNALQTQFGPSKYTSLNLTLQNATPN